MAKKQPVPTSHDTDIIEFKIPQSVLECPNLSAEQKIIWLIANKLSSNKEFYMQIIEGVLFVSKHKIYKMINDMIRDGYLKKITTTKEIKDMICTEKETESYLVAIVPSILDDNSDNDSAPF